MAYKPLVIDAGQIGQLPAGQALDAGGWTLPVVGGTEDYVLTADASGNAIWQPVSAVSSNYPDPTDANQALISSAVDAAAWVTAGSNKVLASNAGGILQFEAKPFAWNISSPSASGYALVSSGAGAAGWYETMLTGLLVQAPSAGDEGKALTMDATGKAVTVATTLTDLITNAAPSPTLENKVVQADAAGKLQLTTPSFGFNLAGPAAGDQILVSSAASTAAWQTPGVDKVVTTDGSGALTFASKPFGYNLASPAASDQTLVSSGAGAASWQTVGLDKVYTTDVAGTVAFVAKPAPWTWLNPADAGRVFVSTGANVTSWQINTFKDVQTAPSAGNDGKVLKADSSGYAQWVVAPFGYGLASPAASDQTLVSTAAGAASWQTPGVNKVYTTDGSGVVAFVDKTFGYSMAAPTAAAQLFRATAADTAAWTTDITGLTSLGVDNITINGAVITSATGAISFDNEYLSTTGRVAVGRASAREQLEVESGTGGVIQVSRNDLSLVATNVIGSYQYYTNDDSASAAGVVAALRYICDGTWNGANNEGHWGVFVQDSTSSVSTLVEGLKVHNYGDVEVPAGSLLMPAGPVTHTKGSGAQHHRGLQVKGTTTALTTGTCIIDLPSTFTNAMVAGKILGYTYSADEGPWSILFGGYVFNPASDKRWANYRASVQGAVPFTQIRLGYNGNTSKACIMLGDTTTEWNYQQISVEDFLVGFVPTALQGDWSISFTTDETNFYNNDPTYADPKVVEWTRDYPPPSEANQALISTGDKVAVWRAAKVLQTANSQYWVDAGGNDVTGDGSESLPFATVDRAIEELDKISIGDNTAWITINAGHYTHTNRIKFQHPEGGKVTFDGVSEALTGQSTTSIGSTEYDLTTVTGDLDYVEVTITLTGKTLAVGDYILIKNASSGTNPEALQGCHKVESWASDVATIRIIYKAGVTLPSGTINFDCSLVRTVLNFTGTNGLEANGPYNLGTWKDVIFAGDPNDSDCTYGIWLDNAASITLTTTTGIRGWLLGLLVRYNATANANGSYISCCRTYGIESVNAGAVLCQAAYLSGCNNSSIYAYIGGTINANSVNITGSGSNGVRASNSAAVYIANGVIKNSTNDVLYATVGSSIQAQAEDVSVTQVYYDSTATCSPVRNATGNYGAVMFGGPY